MTNHKRFGPTVTSPGREKAARGVIPSNTEASTHWAVKNFKLWATNRSAVPSDPVPESHDPNLRLRRYVMETRRDGHAYPPPRYDLSLISDLYITALFLVSVHL